MAVLFAVALSGTACGPKQPPADGAPPPHVTVDEPAPQPPPRRKRSLRIRVVDEDGSPTGERYVRVWWGEGRDAKHGTPLSFERGEDGAMLLEGLPAVPLTMCAMSGSFVVPTTGMPRVVVAADTKEVVLTLDEGTTRTFRVLGWSAGRSGAVYMAAVEDLEPSQHSVEDDGTVRVEGLHPGATYNIYIRDHETHDAVLVSGLEFAASWPDVELARGKTVTGRVLLPVRCESPSVALLVDRAVMIEGRVTDDSDEFTVPAVPPGTYTLVAYAVHDGSYLSGTAEVTAGGSATIDLRPEDER